MPNEIWAAIIGGLITLVPAGIGAIYAYGSLSSRVRFLEKEIEKMQDKSDERQRRIYSKLNEIEKEIKDIAIRLAKMNGE